MFGRRGFRSTAFLANECTKITYLCLIEKALDPHDGAKLAWDTWALGLGVSTGCAFALWWCIAPAQHVLYGTELLGLLGSTRVFSLLFLSFRLCGGWNGSMYHIPLHFLLARH